MNVKGLRVLVVGMAKSGIASATLLASEGARVTINDTKSANELADALKALNGVNYTNALGVDPLTLLDDTDMIVLSPGVPLSAPFAVEAKKRGIKVIGEIELGYLFAKAPIVAITGTNGKTTTTALTGELFRAAGFNTFVLGNIGVPIAQEAKNTKSEDVIVAEVAGFQLDSTERFRAKSCAILNLTEDHLDRFKTMENYGAAKAMILNNQTKDDFAVFNADDPLVSDMAKRAKSKVLWFSRKREVEQGAFVHNGEIIFRMDGKEYAICRADELKIPGSHNLENALAAVAVSLPVGVSPKAAATALRSFPGVEHRIELVCEKNGVRYINDSKATNPDSTVKAIDAIQRPTVLLLGGSNKNSDYTPVFKAFGGKVKAVVAYGFTRDQIERDAKKTGYSPIYICDGSFEDAVLLAKSLAKEGDDVLLSPACASYDMFSNFEERGRVFKELVRSF
ncbi:MAG: UDP-N-acetylmuramoyl-L-alanine--D-glutamate ligase [Christensenellales bacterium]|jgi:UDP-N-acetylmuramoylalanine--D-glutamate ligase